MSIVRTIRKYEHRFDVKAENFVWKHPFLGFLLVFVGIPAFVLICVCISTTVIAFPIAWLFGYL